jgi:hypothetical protein
MTRLIISVFMEKLCYLMIVVIILGAATSFHTVLARIDYAPFVEGNPCAEGEIPQTDDYGQIITDPVTGQPYCITGP